MKKVFTSLILAAYLVVGAASACAARTEVIAIDPVDVSVSTAPPETPPPSPQPKFRRHLLKLQTLANPLDGALIELVCERVPAIPEPRWKEPNLNFILIFRAELLREFRSPPGS